MVRRDKNLEKLIEEWIKEFAIENKKLYSKEDYKKARRLYIKWKLGYPIKKAPEYSYELHRK